MSGVPYLVAAALLGLAAWLGMAVLLGLAIGDAIRRRDERG